MPKYSPDVCRKKLKECRRELEISQRNHELANEEIISLREKLERGEKPEK